MFGLHKPASLDYWLTGRSPARTILCACHDSQGKGHLLFVMPSHGLGVP